jgi:hypothetical protein
VIVLFGVTPSFSAHLLGIGIPSGIPVIAGKLAKRTVKKPLLERSQVLEMLEWIFPQSPEIPELLKEPLEELILLEVLSSELMNTEVGKIHQLIPSPPA